MLRPANFVQLLLLMGLTLAGGWFWSACDAPRDNPLDPQSPLYRVPGAPARITDLTLVEQDGFRARLTWTSPTDAYEYRLYYGSATWNGQSLVGAALYPGDLPGVRLPGVEQSAWIDVPPGQTTNWSMRSISCEGALSEASNLVAVTAPPRDHSAVVIVSAYTRRVALWSEPLDWVSVVVEASVADTDGVDSVWIQLDATIIGKLTSLEDGLNWYGEFPDFDLPGGSVEALVGHPLRLYHLDKAGFCAAGPSFPVIRVFNRVPVVNAPAANDTVGPLPELTWRVYSADFPFIYILRIVHVNQVYVPTAVLTDTIDDVYAETYAVRDPLTFDPQYFLWTLSVVDEFGDEARSSEAIFRVMPDE